MIRKAAETMSDPADLINVAVAELSKAGIELPAYSTLDRLVGTLRQQVHAELYVRATRGLTAEQKDQLDTLLAITPGGQVTGFNLLKNTPGPAKLKYIREWAAHLQQLERIIDPRPFLTDIPHTKIRQFAAEASALEISDIRNMRHREPDVHRDGEEGGNTTQSPGAGSLRLPPTRRGPAAPRCLCGRRGGVRRLSPAAPSGSGV
jgi:Domain of unknown function (DUF4158)